MCRPVLFTANLQSLEGACDVVERAAAAARNRLPWDRSRLLVLPVASRFDSREEYQQALAWRQRFGERLTPFYRDWLARDIEPRELIDRTTIPYISRWSFGEELVANRDAYVAEAKQLAAPAAEAQEAARSRLEELGERVRGIEAAEPVLGAGLADRMRVELETEIAVLRRSLPEPAARPRAQAAGRSVAVGGDAQGSVIVTGDDNKVSPDVARDGAPPGAGEAARAVRTAACGPSATASRRGAATRTKRGSGRPPPSACSPPAPARSACSTWPATCGSGRRPPGERSLTSLSTLTPIARTTDARFLTKVILEHCVEAPILI